MKQQPITDRDHRGLARISQKTAPFLQTPLNELLERHIEPARVGMWQLGRHPQRMFRIVYSWSFQHKARSNPILLELSAEEPGRSRFACPHNTFYKNEARV